MAISFFRKSINYFLKFFLIVITTTLFLQSIFSTSFVGVVREADGTMVSRALNTVDYPLIHLIVLISFIIALYLCYFLIKKIFKEKSVNVNSGKIMWFLGSITFAATTIWIMGTQLEPRNDPAKVFQIAMQWRNGNFSSLVEGGYLFRYSYQVGMVLFYYIISYVVGINNYVGVQFVNVVALVFIYFFIAKLSHCFWQEDKIFPVFTQVALMLWVPFSYYVTYIYGILPGLAFALASIYWVIRYIEKRKIRYICGAAIFIGIAIMIKSNFVIYFIALVCILGYDLIDTLLLNGKKALRQSLLTLSAILLLISGWRGGKYISKIAVEKLSGYELSDGTAMISFVVMGLSEASFAPGSFTGYTVDVYLEHHYDMEQINKTSVEDIKEILRQMAEYPLEKGIPFFARKTAFQWNDPVFLGMNQNQARNTKIVQPKWISSLIHGKGELVLTIFYNYVQSLIWAGIIFYFCIHWKNLNLFELTLGIVFLGGFLCHLFWEASPTYTMPYFLLMIPYAVKGFFDIIKKLYGRMEQIKKRTLKLEKKEMIFAFSGIFLGITVAYLFGNTNFFHRIIALDDGKDAQYQFYNRTVADGGGKEYCTISPYVENELFLTQKDGEIILTDSNPERILLQRSSEGVSLRFGGNEQVLATEIETQNVFTYMDDGMNLFYENRPDAEYYWSIVENGEGSKYIMMDEYALTWEEGVIQLKPYKGDYTQKWSIN